MFIISVIILGRAPMRNIQNILDRVNKWRDRVRVTLFTKKNNNISLSVPPLILFQNIPNPFSERTIIRYQIFEHRDIRLNIYNSAGEIIKTLVKGRGGPGIFEAIWDGRDEKGHRVRDGVYFYRLETKGYERIRKMELRSL